MRCIHLRGESGSRKISVNIWIDINILYLGAALNLGASAAAADGQFGNNFWGGLPCKQSKVYK